MNIEKIKKSKGSLNFESLKYIIGHINVEKYTGQRNILLILLMALTGARLIHLSNFKSSNWFELLEVSRTYLVNPMGGISVALSISAQGAAILKELTWANDFMNEHGDLFRTKDSKSVNSIYISAHINHWIKSLGISNVTTNNLRGCNKQEFDDDYFVELLNIIKAKLLRAY